MRPLALGAAARQPNTKITIELKNCNLRLQQWIWSKCLQNWWSGSTFLVRIIGKMSFFMEGLFKSTINNNILDVIYPIRKNNISYFDVTDLNITPYHKILNICSLKILT